MTIRIERRYGKIGVDIRFRLPDGRRVRERCVAPIQDEAAALKWARKREIHLLDGFDIRRTKTTLDRAGQIYFVQVESGAIKIGWSSDLGSRLVQLRVGTHESITLLAAMPGALGEEKKMHKRFAQARIRREWYRPDPELLTHIATIPGGPGRDCASSDH